MKVLMLTPRMDMNHPIFGFAHGWAEELSRRVDHLDIIAFNVGETSLPENTSTYSAFSSTQAFKLLKLNKLLFSLVPGADIIFTHMYPWFPIAAKPYALLFRKPLVMWNAHGHVDFKKKIALALVEKVVTSSEKGFNISTPKKVVINQGIDTRRFSPNRKEKENTFTIISVGRLDRAKGYDTVIKAFDILINEKKKKAELRIIGPVKNRETYSELRKLANSKDLNKNLEFAGPVPYGEIEAHYQSADLYISASTTGSLDKTTLEAMASGLPVIVCNPAFLDIFDQEMKEKCYFQKNNPRELANKIEHFMNNDEKELSKRLRNVVIENHGEEAFAEKLVGVLKGVVW